MENNKQKRKNLFNDMPIDNRATSPTKMRDYGKPTSPVAMRMAATKATLPMSASPLLENGDKEKKTGEKKEVKSYNVKTGEESTKIVKSDSPDATLTSELGGTLEFESADQSINSLTRRTSDPRTGGGVNRNIYATKATFGTLPKNFKGRARDKNNRLVDFSTNNNDSRRSEKFRLN